MRVNGCVEPASMKLVVRYSRRPLAPKKAAPEDVTTHALTNWEASALVMLTSCHVTPPSAVIMISVRPGVTEKGVPVMFVPPSAMPCSGLLGLNERQETPVFMVPGTTAFVQVAPKSRV